MQEMLKRLETAKARLESKIDLLDEALDWYEGLSDEDYQANMLLAEAIWDAAIKMRKQAAADLDDVKDCLEDLKKASFKWYYLDKYVLE